MEKVFEAHSSYVTTLKFHVDGTKLFSAGMDGIIKVWDVDSWGLISEINAHDHRVNVLHQLQTQNDIVLTGSNDMLLQKINWKTGKIQQTFSKFEKPIDVIALSPDEKYIVAGSYEGKVALWDLSNGEKVKDIDVEGRNITGLRFTEDSEHLWVSGMTGNLTKHKIPSGETVEQKPVNEKFTVALLDSENQLHLFDTSSPL